MNLSDEVVYIRPHKEGTIYRIPLKPKDEDDLEVIDVRAYQDREFERL